MSPQTPSLGDPEAQAVADRQRPEHECPDRAAPVRRGGIVLERAAHAGAEPGARRFRIQPEDGRDEP
jgi:hypothetical protein